MAKLKTELPPHCRVKNRGKYKDVYFEVHIKDRPEGWPPSIRLGRTDIDSIDDIVKKGISAYQSYRRFVLDGPAASRSEEGTLPYIIEAYKTSHFWKHLAPKTKRDYEAYLLEIASWSKRSSHPHISLLTVKSIIKWLNKYKDTPVRMKRAKSVLSVLYKIAYNEGFIDNKRLVQDIELEKQRQEDKRPIVIWTENDVDAVVREADDRGLYSIGSIALTCMETCQRRGDVVPMINGRDYKNGQLRYFQSKTKKHVWFKATDKLRERLDRYHSQQVSMFINENTGRPWHPDSVTHQIRNICDHLGMTDHILMQMRHSQINYLYELGLDDQTIIAMSGHENPQTMRAYYREKRNKELANKGVEYINKERKHKESRTKK